MGYGDWQIGIRGGWQYDYAYIVGTALEVADRRAWEYELLDYYPRPAARGRRSAPRSQHGMAGRARGDFLPVLRVGLHDRASELPAEIPA